MKQKFVTEALGGCWHEWKMIEEKAASPMALDCGGNLMGVCEHCGKKKLWSSCYPNLDLTTPDGFFWMLQEGSLKIGRSEIEDILLEVIVTDMPRLNFLNAVAHHLGYEEE